MTSKLTQPRVARNVAVSDHPLHNVFRQWCRVEMRFPNRESGLIFARVHRRMMECYATPKKA